MNLSTIALPCHALNAGGASDASRYTLPATLALAESLLRGVDPSAGPIAVVERATDTRDMLALFDTMLPTETVNAKGKDVLLRINVPDAENGSKVHTRPLADVRQAIASLTGETGTHAVVNGTRRTLALALIWAMGLEVPTLPTVTVEGTDSELRDMSASGNEIHVYAKAMSYQSRLAYALSLYRDGVTTEAQMMARAKVGRGIAQLMHSAAVAIDKHDIQPNVDGQMPKLDKEGSRSVRDVEPGNVEGVAAALSSNLKGDTRTLSLKRIAEIAERCKAGVAGDVLRAIAADDVAALGTLLGVPV